MQNRGHHVPREAELPEETTETHKVKPMWAIEGEHSPKPLGAWWLRFFWDRGENRVRFEYTRAV